MSAAGAQPKCILIFHPPERPERDRSAEACTSYATGFNNMHKLAANGCSTSIAYRDGVNGSAAHCSGQGTGFVWSTCPAQSRTLRRTLFRCTAAAFRRRTGAHASALRTNSGLLKLLASIAQQGSTTSTETSTASSYLQVRFPTLQAGFVSNCNTACAVAQQAGCDLLLQSDHWDPLLNTAAPDHEQSSAASTAHTLLSVLDAPLLESGVQASASVQPTKQYDLLLIYLTQPGSSMQNARELHSDAKQQILCSWLDDFVGYLSADPSAQTHLLLVLILSNLCESNVAAPKRQQMTHEDFPQVLQPTQSHCLSNTHSVSQDTSTFSLMVQHLPGVVRQDAVQRVSLGDTRSRGGGGCILAEHVLPELAYKLGKAPKYGA